MHGNTGKKNALGNHGGRPVIYDDPEKMQVECDGYFDYIEGEQDDDGNWIRHPQPATITGLALYIGLSGRKVFDDYRKKEAFKFVTDRAHSRVEHAYECNLSGAQCTGSIFALKNMGWKDKTEIDTNINAHVSEQPIEFK